MLALPVFIVVVVVAAVEDPRVRFAAAQEVDDGEVAVEHGIPVARFLAVLRGSGAG